MSSSPADPAATAPLAAAGRPAGSGRISVGLALPFFDQYVAYPTMLACTEQAERSGFDSVWLSDHLVGPTPGGANRWFEVTTVLAALAARVPRIRVATDVLVAAYRHPLQSAKALVTVDHVSGGRLIVGLGSGYLAHEFRALGLDLAERGRVADACLAVWATVWTADRPTVGEIVFEPRPVQRPGPPVLVGNAGPAVLRRAALRADGWHPMGLPLAQVAAGATTVRQLAEAAGRPPPILSYAALFGEVGGAADDAPDRPPLTGSVAQVLDDVDRLAASGVTNVVFRPGTAGGTPASVADQVDLLAAEVLPAL